MSENRDHHNDRSAKGEAETLGFSPSASGSARLKLRSTRYRTKRLLHKGAFGVVYLAVDEELKRDVVVKIPDVSHPGARKQFLREVRLAAGLHKRGLVPIYDFGESEDGILFAVMPYYSAGSLAGLINEKDLSPVQTADLMISVCDALHHAHTKGNLIHRDLKPENILIDEDGHPCIADFGLAVSREAQRDGESGGTLAYMSPEQLQDMELDSRTDIWSLGVILYRMLTGRLPFASIEDIFRDSPVPPRQINEAVPAELERICLKCFSRQLSDQYSTARDLAGDLRRWRQCQDKSLWRKVVFLGVTGCLLIAGLLYVGLSGAWSTEPLRVEVMIGPIGGELSREQDLPVLTGEAYTLRVKANQKTLIALLQFGAEKEGAEYEIFDMLSEQGDVQDKVKSRQVSPGKTFTEDFRTVSPPGTEVVFVLTAPNERELQQKYRKLKSRVDALPFDSIGVPERVLRELRQRGRFTRMTPDDSAEGKIKQLKLLKLAENDKLLFIWNILPAEDSDPAFSEEQPERD